DRVTLGWSQRVVYVGVFLVLLSVAVAIAAGHEMGQALLQGVVQGVTTFLFAWLLLRYDLRAVPPFVATGLVLEAIRRAFGASTPAGWVMCLITAAVAIALAAWAVRYLSRQAIDAVPEGATPQP